MIWKSYIPSTPGKTDVTKIWIRPEFSGYEFENIRICVEFGSIRMTQIPIWVGIGYDKSGLGQGWVDPHNLRFYHIILLIFKY